MRFVVLPLLAVVPLTLAAPVPKFEPKLPPSYTAEELAKLPFVDADQLPKELVGRGDGPKPGTVALAVTLPKINYATGEPVVPLFALQNRTDRAIGLGIRLDFTGDELELWNSAAVEIRDTGTGKVVGPYRTQTQALRKGEGERVPAGGYYVAGGNVGTGQEGTPLPAGEYELSWRYGWATSNTVKFRVADRAFRGPLPYKSVRLIHVTEHGHEVRKKLVDREFGLADEWDTPGLHPVEPASVAVTLGTGRVGSYVPSLRHLPETTDKLKAAVKWAREDGADSFTLTLAVRPKDATAEVPGSPHVYLLIECDTPADSRRAREQLQDELARADRRIAADSPYELTVKLPKDWTDHAEASGPARVAVLVSTKELHDDWGDRMEKAKAGQDEQPDWVIRTPWRDITLPKPVEKLRKGGR